jgi:hypothetical protein
MQEPACKKGKGGIAQSPVRVESHHINATEPVSLEDVERRKRFNDAVPLEKMLDLVKK